MISNLDLSSKAQTMLFQGDIDADFKSEPQNRQGDFRHLSVSFSLPVCLDSRQPIALETRSAFFFAAGLSYTLTLK